MQNDDFLNFCEKITISSKYQLISFRKLEKTFKLCLATFIGPKMEVKLRLGIEIGISYFLKLNESDLIEDLAK